MKNDIITAHRVGKRTYYKINLANKYSPLINDILNTERRDLNNMNPRIVVILREFTRIINDTVKPTSVYVFGSIVKSSYREDSDIDIAIITNRSLGTKERIISERIGERIEKRFGREIQTHFFTEMEFSQTKDALIEQIHRDGIKLV